MNMRYYLNISILLASVFLFSCSGSSNSNDSLFELKDANQRAFVDNLAKFCGQRFSGQETYIAEGRESWADKKMTIHFVQCTKDLVAIAFSLGGDESRTWLLMEEEGRFRFRHDHRNVDGTPEEITLYGGYATEAGTSNQQVFPADDYTCQLLPNACQASWKMDLAQDLSSFSYSLINVKELLFKAEFDLTQPLN
jgi:hypothetical protein